MMRRLAVAAIVLVVAAGCGSSGNPETFNEQFADLTADEQALYGISDASIPVELRNWMEGCVGAAGTDDTVSVSNPAASCRCSFDDIVAFLLDFSAGATEEERQRIAFDSFKGLDSAAEDAEPFQTQIREIIGNCNA